MESKNPIRDYYREQIKNMKEKDNRPKTIICDIDGTLILHEGPILAAMVTDRSDYRGLVLPQVKEKFEEWDRKGYYIVLLTGRKESMRKNTISYLSSLGLFWDQLIMGIGGGPRVLINDRKVDGTDTAFAINLERNEGLKNVNV